MNYELIGLEEILKKLNDGEAGEELLGLEQEKIRISVAMKLAVMNSGKNAAGAYIRTHQYGLYELLEKVNERLTKSKSKAEIISCNRITKLLCELFCDIEKRYPDHFDKQAILPGSISNPRLAHLRESFSDLFSQTENGQAQHELMKMLAGIIFSEIDHDQKVSLHKISYLKIFAERLTLMTQDKVPVESFEFILFIASLNFNHPAFYNLCYEFIRGQKDALETAEAQLEVLKFYIKRAEQTPPILSVTYLVEMRSIQESLRRLIDAEITYLERSKENGDNLNLMNSHFKINLTVRQLAIFINLQSSCGIIQTDKPKLIHEYVTSHYSTEETAHISEKSFKNAYYSNAIADLDKVLEKLTEMLIIGQRRY